jgi:hypothetical protein
MINYKKKKPQPVSAEEEEPQAVVNGRGLLIWEPHQVGNAKFIRFLVWPKV